MAGAEKTRRSPKCPGRGPPVEHAACANKPALFAQAVLFTIAFPLRVTRSAPHFVPPSWSPIVFSLLGVLGIVLVLFVVVALTAGLILGK